MIRCYVNQNQKTGMSIFLSLHQRTVVPSMQLLDSHQNRLMLGREVYQPQDLWFGMARAKVIQFGSARFPVQLGKGLRDAHDVCPGAPSNSPTTAKEDL